MFIINRQLFRIMHNQVRFQSVKEMISGNKPVTKKSSSVSKQFQHSLTKLMKTLSDSAPYFIRCIKSNNEKVQTRNRNRSNQYTLQTPDYFDDNIILRQLRYTGMLETVRIRRAGYSIRMEFPVRTFHFEAAHPILINKLKAFAKQYRILLDKGIDSRKEDIMRFIKGHSLIETQNIQYGHSKVPIFLKGLMRLTSLRSS